MATQSSQLHASSWASEKVSRNKNGGKAAPKMTKTQAKARAKHDGSERPLEPPKRKSKPPGKAKAPYHGKRAGRLPNDLWQRLMRVYDVVPVGIFDDELVRMLCVFVRIVFSSEIRNRRDYCAEKDALVKKPADKPFRRTIARQVMRNEELVLVKRTVDFEEVPFPSEIVSDLDIRYALVTFLDLAATRRVAVPVKEMFKDFIDMRLICNGWDLKSLQAAVRNHRESILEKVVNNHHQKSQINGANGEATNSDDVGPRNLPVPMVPPVVLHSLPPYAEEGIVTTGEEISPAIRVGLHPELRRLYGRSEDGGRSFPDLLCVICHNHMNPRPKANVGVSFRSTYLFCTKGKFCGHAICFGCQIDSMYARFMPTQTPGEREIAPRDPRLFECPCGRCTVEIDGLGGTRTFFEGGNSIFGAGSLDLDSVKKIPIKKCFVVGHASILDISGITRDGTQIFPSEDVAPFSVHGRVLVPRVLANRGLPMVPEHFRPMTHQESPGTIIYFPELWQHLKGIKQATAAANVQHRILNRPPLIRMGETDLAIDTGPAPLVLAPPTRGEERFLRPGDPRWRPGGILRSNSVSSTGSTPTYATSNVSDTSSIGTILEGDWLDHPAGPTADVLVDAGDVFNDPGAPDHAVVFADAVARPEHAARVPLVDNRQVDDVRALELGIEITEPLRPPVPVVLPNEPIRVPNPAPVVVIAPPVAPAIARPLEPGAPRNPGAQVHYVLGTTNRVANTVIRPPIALLQSIRDDHVSSESGGAGPRANGYVYPIGAGAPIQAPEWESAPAIHYYHFFERARFGFYLCLCVTIVVINLLCYLLLIEDAMDDSKLNRVLFKRGAFSITLLCIAGVDIISQAFHVQNSLYWLAECCVRVAHGHGTFRDQTLNGLSNGMWTGNWLGVGHSIDGNLTNFVANEGFTMFRHVVIYKKIYDYLLAHRAGTEPNDDTIRFMRAMAFGMFPEAPDDGMLQDTCIVAAQTVLNLHRQDAAANSKKFRKFSLKMMIW